MADRIAPRLFSIAPGAPFLATLADALLDGALVEGFPARDDPMALADATLYLPTRRAARELGALLARRAAGGAIALPVIRPLGAFDDDEAAFTGAAELLELAPAMEELDRLVALAPLVRAWKARLPGHIAARFEEEVTVPASAADAVWLARDLAGLMDEVETEGADWARLAGLVPEDLAGWWQVTLDFLSILTEHWPSMLAERGLSSPAAHRVALIDAETRRLLQRPPRGPVVAAGSTGSVPATARLLSAIARLPQGAVVLPGLDRDMDERSWAALGRADAPPAVHGHPQYGLCRLLSGLEAGRDEVVPLGTEDGPLYARTHLVAAALRPAETTDDWAQLRAELPDPAAALDGVTLVEAANEREEAAAIAVALRLAAGESGKTAALVTPDRTLARRVAVELRRHGIVADDSAGRPLANTPPAELFRLLVEAACGAGGAVALVSLLKHPLLACGMERARARHAAEVVDLVVFRGGTGRPALSGLPDLFERRLTQLGSGSYPPFWLARLSAADIEAGRQLLAALMAAVAPLFALAKAGQVDVPSMARASAAALEAVGRDEEGGLDRLYEGEAGAALADALAELAATTDGFDFEPLQWPDVAAALLSGRAVHPRAPGDPRIFIWGALEARLIHVDTVVLGGLNEGAWPHRATPDRFMSRVMKSGMELGLPERRIGQAAHDFWMAMGAPRVVLARSLRAGDAPSVASRWLQRLLALAGPQAGPMRLRGRTMLAWADGLGRLPAGDPAPRPSPAPPLDVRPPRFSVTEIETLRRDPYAVYARRILRLRAMEPMVRDPGAAERGNLFHDILHGFALSGADPFAADAEERLVEIGRNLFAEADLPVDVASVWWPRFLAMAGGFIAWERDQRPHDIISRLAEAGAAATVIGATGVTLSGRADRIDLLPGGFADIIDFKTGSSPSKGQAHTLLAPQLALEGALLQRGAFGQAGGLQPRELAHIRLKADGRVIEETILKHGRSERSAPDLSEEAWRRLEALVAHYRREETGYLSRALPFRAGDTDGEYDHLARVQEWSAGAGAAGEGEA